MDVTMHEIGRMECGAMTLLWYSYMEKVMFAMVPTGLSHSIPVHREYLDAESAAFKGHCRAFNHEHANTAVFPDSCVQLKLADDDQCGAYEPGQSTRNAPSCFRDLKFEALDIKAQSAELRMVNERHGLHISQTYAYRPGDSWITVNTTLVNQGSAPVTLEGLASFSLGCLSLFQTGSGKDCYEILQWHSAWADEARLEVRNVEEMGIDRSWSGYTYRGFRVGARTSVPAQNAFPQLAFFDRKARVAWGASVTAFGPWMLEIGRMGDFLNLSGGLPDREYTGWLRELQPGESFAGPVAALAVCQVPEGVEAADAIGNCLAPYASADSETLPAIEQTLPPMFNDWCKTWGKPSRENLLPVVERLKGTSVAYLTMDFGWFFSGAFGRPEDARPEMGDIGDWNQRDEYYQPGGFAAWLDEIRAAGLKPGVWFELENVVQGSLLFKQRPEWLLTRNGRILTDGDRAFLDFRKPEVQEYLNEKVIQFVKRNSIAYVKSDYNAPIGTECDGPCASGSENMRQVVEAMADFYRRFRRELPDVVLEICASGGLRISPAWMRLGTLASCSDAHEGVEIPLIAADVNRLIAARGNGIWTTLHDWDSEERLMYSLCAGCLGRIMLSGDVERLAPWQMDIVRRALDFHAASAPVIADGSQFIHRRLASRSYPEPAGMQLVTRVANDGSRMLAILHAFENAENGPDWLVPGNWRIERAFVGSKVKTAVRREGPNSRLFFSDIADFSAAALLLQRD